MKYALVITSVPQLEEWIQTRRDNGYLSAQFYMPPDRDLQLSVETYCQEHDYQTIFIFDQIIKATIMTEARVLL